MVARYVHAHAPKLYVDAVINGTMCLDDAYEQVIEGEYKARANQKKLPELERRRLTLD